MIEEFERMGARTLTDAQSADLAAKSFSDDGPVEFQVLGQRKVTLVDYSLAPDMVIIDPVLTLSRPPAVTADTGSTR